MVTEDGRDVQRAEKVTLKRKLTGPPRLLPGKTRSRSEAEDRPETTKHSPAADSDTTEQTQTANLDDEILSEGNVGTSRGRCEAAGEDDDIRIRKVNRRRWWRRFSPAVVCDRKQKKDVEESLEEQKNDGSVPPEGALQETDSAVLKNTEEKIKRTKRRKRFNVRTWPTFKRFLTSTDVRIQEQKRDFVDKDGDKPPTTFRKKMLNFFTKGGKSRSSDVPLENMEDMMNYEEAPCSPVAQVDEPAELHDHVTVQSLEVVTAEVSVQLTESRAAAESPDETPAEDQLVRDVSVTEEDLTDPVNVSETVQNDGEVVEATNIVPVKDLTEVLSPDKDQVFCESTRVVLDADEPLSTSTTSSQEASGVQCEEKTNETASRPLQPSSNRPSIRIELVPPDDVGQEDEEEECWEGGSSSENHNHLLLLLGFESSERQLVQMAHSLVRTALNAAVDQLTREQQSDADCVHREPLGCRDHA